MSWIKWLNPKMDSVPNFSGLEVYWVGGVILIDQALGAILHQQHSACVTAQHHLHESCNVPLTVLNAIESTIRPPVSDNLVVYERRDLVYVRILIRMLTQDNINSI